MTGGVPQGYQGGGDAPSSVRDEADRGVGGGAWRHPNPRALRGCGDLVCYPCTGDGVSSGAGTAVPVVAGAAMRQRVVGTGIATGFWHSRLPVCANRSYDLHGVLGGKTGAHWRTEGRCGTGGDRREWGCARRAAPGAADSQEWGG